MGAFLFIKCGVFLPHENLWRYEIIQYYKKDSN